MNRRSNLRALVYAVAVGVCLVALAVAGLLLRRPSERVSWTFRTHKKSLLTIVGYVKKQGVPVGRYRHYRVDQSLGPATVRAYDSSETDKDYSAGKVAAYRSGPDSYVITIVTEDDGHLGMYGLLYSDEPLEVASDGGHPVAGAVSVVFVGRRLAAHWWYAYNDTF